MAGLATGWLLQERIRATGQQSELVVLEAMDQPGGSTRTERLDGYLCEWGPNGFLDNEPATLELVRRLGLADRLQPASAQSAHRFIFHSGRLREVPTKPPAFLRSDIVPPSAKLRMALELAVPAKRDEDDETVYEFGRRRLGRQFAELLLDPMVSGIFAGNVRELSLRAAFPKMAELERAHGGLFRALAAKALEARRSGAKIGGPAGPAATLHTFVDGMGELSRGLADGLGQAVQTTRPATALERAKGRFVVHTAQGAIDADAVVLACPSYAAADIVRELSAETAAALDGIEHAPVDVVCQGYHHGDIGRLVDGFGALIPRSEGLRSLGSLLSDCVFPGQAPADHRLFRTMVGGACDPEVVALSEQALSATVREDLRILFSVRGAPRFERIVRHERGIAQYTVGHLERVAATEKLESDMPGLFFCGASYRGVSINGCAKDAFRVAERAWEQLHG